MSKSAGGRGGAPRPRNDGRGLFGAIDLGTNNCRLLIATPCGGGFRVVDAFSRIVRLGEGLLENGSLQEPAMERATAALQVCANKMRQRGVSRARCVATQACRGADNGAEFLRRVKARTGLDFEVIPPREEARLAVMGCLNLIDRHSAAALVIDIGGGSTELSWVDVRRLVERERRTRSPRPPIVAWASMPVGVVTLAERFPEQADRCAWYEEMCAYVRANLPTPPDAEPLLPAFERGAAHHVGTSGTVTSLAGVHLRLPRYERSKVDGLWVTHEQAVAAAMRLREMCQQERAAEPCVGPERADLVLAGCAILEVISERWPSRRLRVADRGLREGLLLSLMNNAGRGRRGGRRRRCGRRPTGGQGGTE